MVVFTRLQDRGAEPKYARGPDPMYSRDAVLLIRHVCYGYCILSLSL